MIEPGKNIPPQKTGTEVNVEESLELRTPSEARAFFLTIKKRLLDISGWGKIAGGLSAAFELTNEQGQTITTYPRPGNYFKINIPAPGILSGDGYDWVRVEDIAEEADAENQYLSIRVRPASSPLNADTDVAHFYTSEATSNFIIKRQGNKVTAGVHGRNEKPNTEADSLVDKARNALVGTGAVGGFAKLQWKGLVDGLLKKE